MVPVGGRVVASYNLSLCAAELQLAWEEIVRRYTFGQIERRLLITCTHRLPGEQFKLYQVGRRQIDDGSWVVDDDPKTAILTQLDGYVKVSKHNRLPARAIDFAVIVNGKITWHPREYAAIGQLAKDEKLVWGGDWKMKDYPHVELPG